MSKAFFPVSTSVAFSVPMVLVLCALSNVSRAEIASGGGIAEDSTQLAKRLIQSLGSNAYAERDVAARELYHLGRAAIEPLEYAAKDNDSEVSLRATQLLLAMRGRGFMGITLQEDRQASVGSDDPDTDAEAYSENPAPVVRVMGIANAHDFGSAKPFPAELAGMTASDKVLEINGRPINGVKDLMREVICAGPGRIALVLLEREGKKMRVALMLTHNPSNHETPPVNMEQESPSSATDSTEAPFDGRNNILEQPAVTVHVETPKEQHVPDPKDATAQKPDDSPASPAPAPEPKAKDGK